jgi:hypothetical protein
VQRGIQALGVLVPALGEPLALSQAAQESFLGGSLVSDIAFVSDMPYIGWSPWPG